MFGDDFSFEAYGVGGLDEELQTIIRRAFMSRLLPPDMASSLGVSHVRGVLLYGPPGCGKTTVARQIGEVPLLTDFRGTRDIGRESPG
jgi:vesicle-fusing ATPase